MSLFEAMMVDCTKIEQKSTEDGLGGYSTEWSDGEKFKAAIVKNNSMEAKVAEKSGVTELYQITVKEGTQLNYHDIFRRDSDGAVFRVTSNIKDSETPAMASFHFGQVSAERWELNA